MIPSRTSRRLAATLALAVCCRALAGDETNAVAPVTARDFYNAGTGLLGAGKFAGAETMFQSALASQEERVQPAALYNLGHARFAEGAEVLEKGPDAQGAAAQGNTAEAAGDRAIRQAESSLAENDLERMVAAYLEGRGARRELRDAEKAIQAAMDTYGKTLQKWQRSADDFKSAAELNPADTNAARNAGIVEQGIAKLVDSLKKMQSLAAALAGQSQQINDLLNQLKGRIPKQNAPPGEDDDEYVQPGQMAGRRENKPREGEQMQLPLSPDEAKQILNGLSLDSSRHLPMSDKQAAQPKDRKGRDW